MGSREGSNKNVGLSVGCAHQILEHHKRQIFRKYTVVFNFVHVVGKDQLVVALCAADKLSLGKIFSLPKLSLKQKTKQKYYYMSLANSKTTKAYPKAIQHNLCR